jgi:hypothetical protein
LGFGPATGNITHALLWSGSAESVIDLNPSGFDSSTARATNGTQQVGYGGGTVTGNNAHALLWSGTPDSYVDLQSSMPASFVTSGASTITGDTVYGYATDTAGNYHAIEWTLATPEPGGLALAGITAIGLLARRAKRANPESIVRGLSPPIA